MLDDLHRSTAFWTGRGLPARHSHVMLARRELVARSAPGEVSCFAHFSFLWFGTSSLRSCHSLPRLIKRLSQLALLLPRLARKRADSSKSLSFSMPEQFSPWSWCDCPSPARS